MDRNRLLKDISSPEAVTLINENDNEVFKLSNYESISCNLHFFEFLCQMHANWLCNLNMSISLQVTGYHVYQINTMS